MKFYTLNENKCTLYGKMLFDSIDDNLFDMNLDACVNRSQSSDDFLVVSCDGIVDIKDIEDIVFPYGYAFYTDSNESGKTTLYFKSVDCVDESFLSEHTITMHKENKLASRWDLDQQSDTISTIDLPESLKEEFGVDFNDTLAWVEKKRPDLSRGAQIKFARNIIAKRQREAVSALPPTPPATTGIGKVRPDVDPTGILDGVTKIEQYEHCGQDLIIVFDAKSDFDNLRLDDIVYIGDIKSPTSRKWCDRKWKEKDFLKKYWLISGCIYDFYGSDDIILGLHLG